MTVKTAKQKRMVTTIWLPPTLARDAQSAAAREGRTKSELIREAIRRYIRAETGPASSVQQRSALARRVIGSLNLATHPAWNTGKKIAAWRKKIRAEWG